MDIMSWNDTSDKIQNKQEEKHKKTVAYMAHSCVCVCVLSFMWPVEKERRRELGLYSEGFKKSGRWSHLCYNKLIWKWWAGDTAEREMKRRPETRKWCGKGSGAFEESLHGQSFLFLSCQSSSRQSRLCGLQGWYCSWVMGSFKQSWALRKNPNLGRLTSRKFMLNFWSGR